MENKQALQILEKQLKALDQKKISITPLITDLKKIREIIPRGGCILACIPNVQHWSIQVQISTGNFRYQDIGLLDRTHLRWFTRKTIIELFESTGFGIEELQPRIFDDSRKDQFLTTIKRLASRACADPKEAMMDALPFQYLIRATPK